MAHMNVKLFFSIWDPDEQFSFFNGMGGVVVITGRRYNICNNCTSIQKNKRIDKGGEVNQLTSQSEDEMKSRIVLDSIVSQSTSFIALQLFS